MISPQLPLGIVLRESASFNNYVPGANQVCYQTLQKVIARQEQNSLYLWGVTGTGKSHLLQAACHFITQSGGIPVYLPLRDYSQFSVEVLEDLTQVDLVCLDDIHTIASLSNWELALFRLFNSLRDAGIPQLISGHATPAQLGLQLPDLTSRLSWGGVFALQPLDDERKIQALQRHAQGRGLILSREVALYLLQHCPRDMHTLIKWLEQLDYASLAEQRKLTIAFVRTLLHSTLIQSEAYR